MSLRAVLALVVLLCPAQVAADSRVQVAVAAASGFTDNALGAPQAGTPDSDVFFSVTPSFTFSTETRRLVSHSTAAVTVARYLEHSLADSFSARASVALDYDASKTLHTSFTLNGTYTDVAALPPQLLVEAVPVGGAHYFELGGIVAFARDFSPNLRGVEEVHATVHLPVGDDPRARSLAVENAVALQVSRARDAYEARLSAGANLYESQVAGEDAARDFTLGLLGTWFHELSPVWGFSLAGGAAALFDEDTVSLNPLARARLERQEDESHFYVELAQMLRSNPLLAETLLTSSATVGMILRFGPSNSFAFTATGGGAHSRTVGDAPDRSINTAQGMAQLTWGPRENFTLLVTYEAMYQVGDDPLLEETRLLRNAVTAGLTAYWPDERERSRPLGIRLRVRQSEERDLELQERGRRLGDE